jgi:hypothetical protein
MDSRQMGTPRQSPHIRFLNPPPIIGSGLASQLIEHSKCRAPLVDVPFAPLGSTPAPTELSLDQDDGALPSTSVQSFSQWRSSMPDWITKSSPQARENVITLRRDKRLAFNIVLEHPTRKPPLGCNRVKVDASVCADTTSNTTLKFHIHLHYPTTKKRYELVCSSRQRREGKWREIPGLISFKTDGNMVEPKDRKIRAEFDFCCYPTGHRLGDTGYQ